MTTTTNAHGLIVEPMYAAELAVDDVFIADPAVAFTASADSPDICTVLEVGTAAARRQIIVSLPSGGRDCYFLAPSTVVAAVIVSSL